MLKLFWQKFKTEFTYLASEWGPALLNQIMWWTFPINCIWEKNHSFKVLAKIHSIFLIAKKSLLLLSKFTMKDFQCQLKWVRGYIVCALCSSMGYTNKMSEHHWARELEVLISVTVFPTSTFLIEPPPWQWKTAFIPTKGRQNGNGIKYKRKTEDCWEEILSLPKLEGSAECSGYFEVIWKSYLTWKYLHKIFLKGIKLIY